MQERVDMYTQLVGSHDYSQHDHYSYVCLYKQWFAFSDLFTITCKRVYLKHTAYPLQ